MQQVTFVNEHGEITSWATYASSWPLEGTETANGVTHLVDEAVDIGQFRKTNYWNTTSGNWATRVEKPGEFYVWASGAWSVDNARLQSEIREERNRLLNRCDWTQASDSPLSSSDKTAWATYRQSLRDFPEINTATTWEDIVWPTQP